MMDAEKFSKTLDFCSELTWLITQEDFINIKFVSDKISYIMLKGHWCDTVLNVHATPEDKSDD
jgi:hypothetical protein